MVAQFTRNLAASTALGLALGLVSLGAGSAPAQAQSDMNLVISGASAGGFWSTLGAAVNNALQAAYPNSVLTYQTSGGGMANVSLLGREAIPLGIAYDVEARAARDGSEPFQAPIEGLRSVVQIFAGGPTHFLITESFAKEHSVESIGDLKGKPVRYANNRRGNAGSMLCDSLLRGAGVEPDEFDASGGQLIFAASREQIDLMSDGRIDLSCLVGVERSNTFVQMGRARDVKLLTIPQEAIDTVLESVGGIAWTIPADTYDNQGYPVDSVAMATGVLTHAGMDEETIYVVTKAWVENVDAIQAAHAALGGITPQSMTEFQAVPYHPGAERYFREAGLLTD